MEHYYAFQARRMQALLAEKSHDDKVKAAARRMLAGEDSWAKKVPGRDFDQVLAA